MIDSLNHRSFLRTAGAVAATGLAGGVYASSPRRPDMIADLARVAIITRALGRSDSGHKQAASFDRRSRRRCSPLHARGTSRSECPLGRTPVQGARRGQFILSLSNVEAPPKQ